MNSDELERRYAAIEDDKELERFLFGELLGTESRHESELHYRLIQETEGPRQNLLWRAFAARGAWARNFCMKRGGLQREDMALGCLAVVSLYPQSETQALELARRAERNANERVRRWANALIDDLVDGGALGPATRRALLAHLCGRRIEEENCWAAIDDLPRMAALKHYSEHQRFLFVVGDRAFHTISANGLATMEATGTYVPPLRPIDDDALALVWEGHRENRPWIVGSKSITRWSGEPLTLSMSGQTLEQMCGETKLSYLGCAASEGSRRAYPMMAYPPLTVAVIASTEAGLQLLLFCQDSRSMPSIPGSVAGCLCRLALPDTARVVAFSSSDSVVIGTSDGSLISYRLMRDEETVQRLHRKGGVTEPPPPMVAALIHQTDVGFPVAELTANNGHILARGSDTLLWFLPQSSDPVRIEDDTLRCATPFFRNNQQHLALINNRGVTILDGCGGKRGIACEGLVSVTPAETDYVVAFTHDGLALRFWDSDFTEE